MRAGKAVLTERDADLLVSLFKYRYLSTPQVQRLHFPSLQTAARRIRLLSDAGYVAAFRAPAVPERIAMLSIGGAEAVAERLGVTIPELGWEGRRQHPKDYLFLQHFLAVNDFRITLTLCCSARPDLRLLGFIPEHVAEETTRGAVRKYIRGVVSDVGRPREKIAHTPDGVFALERGGVPALFFLEVDRGTEVLTNPERGLLRTVRFYLSYLGTSAYQRFRDDFHVIDQFKGFRVLFVVPSTERLKNIRKFCGRVAVDSQQTKRFVWFTTQEALMDPAILSRPWLSLDQTDERTYSILGQRTAG